MWLSGLILSLIREMGMRSMRCSDVYMDGVRFHGSHNGYCCRHNRPVDALVVNSTISCFIVPFSFVFTTGCAPLFLFILLFDALWQDIYVRSSLPSPCFLLFIHSIHSHSLIKRKIPKQQTLTIVDRSPFARTHTLLFRNPKTHLQRCSSQHSLPPSPSPLLSSPPP